MLTREEILGLNDLEVKAIDVPYWGEVNIRMMTALEKCRVEDTVARMTDDNQAAIMAELKAQVASIVVCDTEGKSLFKQDDIRALGGKSHVALDFILREAQKMAGLSDDALDESVKN